MEAWLKSSLASHYVAKVDATKVQHGVFCEAFLSPWYDDGVVFDWTNLHQRLVQPASPSSSSLYAEQFVGTLAQFGAAAASSAARSGKECFSTVVELKAPWSLHPLSDQAQDLSLFDVSVETTVEPAAADVRSSCPATAGPLPASATSAPQPAHARAFYTFLRGPPGQRAVRDDMARVLASVQTQLRQSGMQVVCFLSSFVLICEDFTDLLHRTAAVFRALTDVGFTVDGHGSSLGPRAVQQLRVNGEDWWTTLPLQKITSEEDVASFLVGLFFQWLQDAYNWGCNAPLRTFPETQERGGSGEQGKGVRLFERFVRGLVLPNARAIGMDALRTALPEEGGSLLELAAVKLEKKLPAVGPQRWSVLELRLVLCQIRAYHYSPAEYLGRTAAPDTTKAPAAAQK